MPTFEVRYLRERSVRGERGLRLLRYLLATGADEFSITVMALHDTLAPFADAFEDELAPYVLPIATRRTLTAATAAELVRPVRLWTLSDASLERLITFMDDGLFHAPAGPDGWLEDLTVYRRGELVLGIVSHEQGGVLRLSAEEQAQVAALDIATELSADDVRY